MKDLITFLIFWAIILTIIATATIPYWLWIAGGLFLVAVILVLSQWITPIRSFLGVVCGKIGRDNNSRLAVMWLITLFLLLSAIKYGPGEPLMPEAYRQAQQMIEQNVSDGFKGQLNYLLYGKREMPKAQAENELIRPVKTWALWRLFNLFLTLSLLYTPIAFRDEFAEFFTNMADRIKTRQDELKSKATPQAEHVSKGKIEVKEGRGIWHKIFWEFGTEFAAEGAMDLLKQFATKLKR